MNVPKDTSVLQEPLTLSLISVVVQISIVHLVPLNHNLFLLDITLLGLIQHSQEHQLSHVPLVHIVKRESLSLVHLGNSHQNMGLSHLIVKVSVQLVIIVSKDQIHRNNLNVGIILSIVHEEAINR
jgi:hypothetical protein